MTRSAAAGHQYQNLVWTPGNVAGTPAITPGTWQDWDTSTGGWVARYNVGGLTAGTAYQLADAEATAKATDPALLAIRASVVYGDTNYGGPYANTTAYVDGLSLGLDGTHHGLRRRQPARSVPGDPGRRHEDADHAGRLQHRGDSHRLRTDGLSTARATA